MSHTPQHLPGIRAVWLATDRLETQLLQSGSPDGEPVLFLHGNLSSSTFWEETMLVLPPRFHGVAPDQRGYGFCDPAARIDATRGVADWADDVRALVDALGWDRFHLVGHSLGGCVTWVVLGSQPERLLSVTLVAPGPPCGFGGARGDDGELIHDDGAGSGAGLIHGEFLAGLQAGDREVSHPLFSPRAVMNRAYWKPPFRPNREEQLLSAMLSVHLGEGRYPGDIVASPHWPGFAPGNWGPNNALSPRYNGWVLRQLLESTQRPRLLWVWGADDAVVCDGALSDAGSQGKLGLRPDWPGEDVFPPQPLIRQVSFAIDRYQATGGAVQRLVLPDVGHTPYLERPGEFQAALLDHLTAG